MIKKEVSVDTLYCNGASWAWGQELGDESESYRNQHSFPGLLSQHYNLSLVNAAVPGASNQRILRTTVADISKLIAEGKKPFVLITWGLTHRFELYNNKTKSWAAFISPDNVDDKSLANKIWADYSSDYSDTIQFIHQIILLESFLKKNNVPYFMVYVHKFDPDSIIPQHELRVLKQQVDTNFIMNDISLQSLVRSYPNIKWGVDHPLEDGHQFLADFLQTHIDIRFNIGKVIA